MSFYQFTRIQKVNATLDELWDFIATPENLNKITPPEMRFRITTGNLPVRMYAGLMIGYRVSPLPGFRTSWLTEITHVVEKEYFVDEQRIGPYRLWHHQHILLPLADGVLMKDVITYALPFGWLGRIANHLMVRPKLKKIFDFRETALERIFGKHTNGISISWKKAV